MCRRLYVSGTVQGVGYRAFARRSAREHGISGYAHNLPDGRVEVLACGAPAALEAFVTALRTGPKWAVVATLREEVAPCATRRGDFTSG